MSTFCPLNVYYAVAVCCMSANWQLTNQHLKVWSDGSIWLTLDRQKTKVPVNVKLLPIALEILDKYKDSIA